MYQSDSMGRAVQTWSTRSPSPLGWRHGDEAHHKVLVSLSNLHICLSVLPCKPNTVVHTDTCPRQDLPMPGLLLANTSPHQHLHTTALAQRRAVCGRNTSDTCVMGPLKGNANTVKRLLKCMLHACMQTGLVIDNVVAWTPPIGI